MNAQQNAEASAFNEEEFRDGAMPRALLSTEASRLAVDKATQRNAKEFAGFELEEAITVVKVLKELGTAAPSLGEEGKAFIEKLRSASGNEFDKLYMQAELANHEFLRDLAKSYLHNAEGKTSEPETEARHLATLALFAFNEHVACAKEFTARSISREPLGRERSKASADLALVRRQRNCSCVLASLLENWTGDKTR